MVVGHRHDCVPVGHPEDKDASDRNLFAAIVTSGCIILSKPAKAGSKFGHKTHHVVVSVSELHLVS